MKNSYLTYAMNVDGRNKRFDSKPAGVAPALEESLALAYCPSVRYNKGVF
jgi:hypothetical protein